MPVNRTGVIRPTDARKNGGYGVATSISNETLAVGAVPGPDDGLGYGAVYIHDIREGSQVGKIQAQDGEQGELFGSEVSLDGNLCAIGALRDDDRGRFSGSAYLFDVVSGRQVHKIVPNDLRPGDRFGVSVGLFGSRIICGSLYDDDNGTDSGSVYVFDTNSGEQQRKIYPNFARPRTYFGHKAAQFDDRIVAGAYGDSENGPFSGAAYIFDANNGNQLLRLQPETPDDNLNFGWDVDIFSNVVIVGSLRQINHKTRFSAAYLFNASTGQQLIKLEPQDHHAFNLFGRNVCVSNGIAVVSSPLQKNANGTVGAVYVFDIQSGQQIVKLEPPANMTGSGWGRSICANNSRIAIGAPAASVDGVSSGAVFTYEVS